MEKFIRNTSGDFEVYLGTELDNNEYLRIDELKFVKASNDEKIISHIMEGKAKMSRDGVVDIDDKVEALNFLKGINDKPIESFPFASKSVENGKLFRRKHGWKIENIQPGETGSVDINCDYLSAKINELEIVNTRVGDNVSLKVKDTPQGHIQMSMGVPPGSITPGLVLNQFGFNCELPDGMFRDQSDYDADIIKDMKITIEYKNAGDEAFTARGNIVFHEVK